MANVSYPMAREFLGRVLDLKRSIRKKEIRVEMLRESAMSTTAGISDMPRSDSPNLQKMEMVICKAVDMEREIEEMREALPVIKAEVSAKLAELPNTDQAEILYGRYVKCMPWSEIEDDFGFGRSTVFRLHNSGLESMENLLAG